MTHLRCRFLDNHLKAASPTMSKPITSAVGDKPFREIADQLLKEFPALCQKRVKGNGNPEPMKSVTLASRLGELDAGVKLLWWKKHAELTQCLVTNFGVDPDDLGLEDLEDAHIFKFVDAPDLPDLDLRRQEHWTIAKPKFVPMAGTNCYLDYPTRAAMAYWLSEQNSIPTTKQVDWLYVGDDLEFELLVRRLKTLGNRSILSCKTLTEVDSDDESISQLLSPTPLIISVQTNSKAADLYKLIGQRKEAPLLVISRFSLPGFENENSKTEIAYRQKINCWEWAFLNDWRMHLLRWIGQRMSDPNASTYFAEQAVQEWLAEHDPNSQWFSSGRDVLRLGQIFSKSSEKELKKLPSLGLGRGLLGLLVKTRNSSRKFLSPMIEARWKRWDVGMEGDLSPEIWQELSIGICKYETLGANKLIVSNQDGLNFEHPMMVRLILRDLLTDQIARKPIQEWAKACFDSERRPIVDAALDAISIEVLTRVARTLEQTKEKMVTIGVGEALFMAIGRRIARTLTLEKSITSFIPDDVRDLLVERVVVGLDFSQEPARPWSRPLNSQSAEIEWVSACWAWSLLPMPKKLSAPNTWLLPGWSTEFPAQFPKWLTPRPQFQTGDTSEATDSSGYASNKNFIAIVEYWLCACNGFKAIKALGYLPVIFKIGLLRQAAKGFWKTELEWWYGLIGTPWAEEAVLRDLVAPSRDGLRTFALNWWPSLVAHFQFKRQEDDSAFNNLWGRWASKSSPVLQWVMEQLKSDSHKALGLLEDEALSFLAKDPQLLNKSFKLELLTLIALRLPDIGWLKLSFLPGFLVNFGADAVEGVIPLLHDIQLGDQAALNLWSWAPVKVEELLRHDESLDIVAKQNLIKKCPPGGAMACIESLQRDKDILSSSELKSWVQKHLPDAGIHASALLGLLTTSTN